MTVAELIDKLKEFDPALMVVIDGYEGGLEELAIVVDATIVLNEREDSWIFGPHRHAGPEWEEKKPTVGAVYLPRPQY